MPAMNAASRPARATPRVPLGRYLFISSGMASLYVVPEPSAPNLGSTAIASRPGMMVSAGMKILG